MTTNQILAIAILRIEHSRSIYSSGVLFIYWLLLVAAMSIKARTLINYAILLVICII